MKTLNTNVTVDELERTKVRQVIDVRSSSEFAAGHVPGAINIPLDQFGSRVEDVDESRPLYLICQHGQRAALAAQERLLRGKESMVVDGGTSAWCAAGYPVVRSVRTTWSLERQVRLLAGVLVSTGVALALIIDPMWVGLSAFVSLGLTFAGLTDFCPMGHALAKAPWNRPRLVK